MEKKILFISQSAGRTGAPLMLLNLLNWLKYNSKLSFEVLLLDDGPLRPEFASLAPVHLFPKASNAKKGIAVRMARRLGLDDDKTNRYAALIAQLLKNKIGLIYSNTIVNGKALEILAPLGCPVITHVHELDYWIEQAGEENLQQVRRQTSRYIAASEAVKTNLVNKYAISSDKIDVVHSFIPVPKVKLDPFRIKQQLGIPEDSFIVLGSGYETWRKGKDIFVLLAAQINKNLLKLPAHFIWVGGWQRKEDRRNICHDIKHLGLKDRVHFIGEVTNPLDYFAAGDVFAMVSREDPFPLVCLEAASLKKPILCFADAGGMPEFVEDDTGFIVPYLDVLAMAKKTIDLMNDEKLRKLCGDKAAQKVRERHDISVAGPSIVEIIAKFD